MPNVTRNEIFGYVVLINDTVILNQTNYSDGSIDIYDLNYSTTYQINMRILDTMGWNNSLPIFIRTIDQYSITSSNIIVISNVTVSNISPIQVLIEWSKPNGGGIINNYNVCIYDSQNNIIFTHIVSPNTFSDNIYGLNIDTNYYVQIIARNDRGVISSDFVLFVTEFIFPIISLPMISVITNIDIMITLTNVSLYSIKYILHILPYVSMNYDPLESVNISFFNINNKIYINLSNYMNLSEKYFYRFQLEVAFNNGAVKYSNISGYMTLNTNPIVYNDGSNLSKRSLSEEYLIGIYSGIGLIVILIILIIYINKSSKKKSKIQLNTNYDIENVVGKQIITETSLDDYIDYEKYSTKFDCVKDASDSYIAVFEGSIVFGENEPSNLLY